MTSDLPLAPGAPPVRHPTRHVQHGRGGHEPRGVVLHTTVDSFEGTASWFADPRSLVSAHYLVGLDGRVATFVDETDTARHAGRVHEPTAPLITAAATDPNLVTIGIEFEDGGEPETVHRTGAQYDAGAHLLAGISWRWNIRLDRHHVIGHREIYARKSCPGNLDIDRLLLLALGWSEP